MLSEHVELRGSQWRDKLDNKQNLLDSLMLLLFTIDQ